MQACTIYPGFYYLCESVEYNIAVISSSVRTGRLSHRVALFLCERLRADMVDLAEYGFPLFHERLKYMEEPPPGAADFARRIVQADGVVVVSPVYNASFPAALKNAVDLLVEEWVKKPVLVASVTSGGTAGIMTVQQLQALFLKLGARVAAPMYTVTNVEKDFAEDGKLLNPGVEKYVQAPVDEFLWLINNSKTL
jgi:NAD(P)H-dependent FMN reductase